jgi:integration host factor subunit alpha
MSDKTLTRMELSEAVFRAVGLSRNESAELVESVLDHMSEALVHGETVKISSFGTFSVRASPRGSVAIPRPARRCRSNLAAC